VKVVANKRADTEMSMISAIRNGSLVASGISRQQISRSQDKDASEVISRVPGVSVRDGKSSMCGDWMSVITPSG